MYFYLCIEALSQIITSNMVLIGALADNYSRRIGLNVLYSAATEKTTLRISSIMEHTALYSADYLITQNAQRDVLRDAALVVRGGRITDIGAAKEMSELYPEATHTALGKAVVLPGLINAHTHAPMSALRGYSDDKHLMDWLTQDIFPIEAQFHAELVEIAARLSMAEMMRTGTTAFYDMYMHSEAVFRAADAMGMRGAVGECLTQYFPSLVAENQQDYFALIADQAARWQGHPRLRLVVTPHAPYTTNPELLQASHEAARQHGALFGLHLAETRSETEHCLEYYRMRPVAYCDALGILDARSSLYHLVEVDESECELLASRGCVAVHNAASNMKLASGCAPLHLMKKAGLRVALGTDGPASNNAQNMVREMYTASLLQKFNLLDPTACPHQEALDMATLGGAAALGDPLIGCLEKGMKADFTALSLTEPHMQPIHHIISTLVYSASGLETILTVVDGEVLYSQGRFLTCDYAALCEQVEDMHQWIVRQR